MMKTIVIIARKEDWQAAQKSGNYEQSTPDSTLAEVGFIHCSFPDQTIEIANRRFSDRDGLVLLLIDEDKVKAPIKHEGAPSGRAGTFPHIYGPLNVDAVYSTALLKKDGESKFVTPKELEAAMNSIPCDIVILPSNGAAQEAISLSRQLEQHSTLFTLRNDAYFPHASLYMTQLKAADLDKVKEILANIATSTPRLNLSATRYYQSEGYIDAEYQHTEQLANLQMQVVEAINPIRDGMREKDKQRMLTITGPARENLEKYGYRGVGEIFRPHLTFTRFADGEPIDLSTLPDPSEFSGQFTKLGLFEMGDNGTCMRKIAEFELGDNQL